MNTQPRQTGRQPWFGRVLGFAGVAVLAAGLFLLTVFLEPLAILLGFFAWREGRRSLARGDEALAGREKMLGRVGMIGGGTILALFFLLMLIADPRRETARLVTGYL